MSSYPRRRQRQVLVLEPSRALATLAYCTVTALAVAVCTSALLYHSAAWPPQWRLSGEIPQRTTSLVALVAGCVAALWLTAAIINGRRWHIARAVVRLSEDAERARVLPDDTRVPPPAERARQIPALGWDDRSPWQVPRPPRLRRVTATHNVVGRRPLSIVYLRTFVNQPRARTLFQGAWREFGYVYLLRSAESVTPAEFRQLKRSRWNFGGLLIGSAEQFAAELARPLPGPSRKRWNVFNNVGPRTVWTRDWYGSYPPRTFLCHGMIWQTCVDMLLDRADLVVFDLSGMMPANGGVRDELQRVINRIPVERVIFLTDRRSDRRYLHAEIGNAWRQMASDSPNSGTRPRVARLAVTDSYRQIQQQQGESTRVYYRLVARRWQSRRLAAELNPDRTSSLAPEQPRRRAADHGSSYAGGITVRAAQFAILICCVLFWISVTLLPGYVKDHGGETLLKAANSDPASPLHPHDFKILIVLVALAFVLTVIGILGSRPSLATGTGLAALGLIGYTVYLPAQGSFPGFGSYGPSYWLSLAVAIAITLSATAAVVAGSRRLRRAPLTPSAAYAERRLRRAPLTASRTAPAR